LNRADYIRSPEARLDADALIAQQQQQQTFS